MAKEQTERKKLQKLLGTPIRVPKEYMGPLKKMKKCADAIGMAIDYLNSAVTDVRNVAIERQKEKDAEAKALQVIAKKAEEKERRKSESR